MEVGSRGEDFLHLEADTENIGNHSGYIFASATAKKYNLKNSKTMQYMKTTRIRQPAQRSTVKQKRKDFAQISTTWKT